MPHGRRHVVALLRVYRHGHSHPSADFGLGPSVFLVVQKKRHKRFERERRVEHGTGQEKVLERRVVVPETREQLAPVFRREDVGYLLLAADFDKALLQDRAPYGRTWLQVGGSDFGWIRDGRQPFHRSPLPALQPFRLEVDDAVAPRAESAQRILLRRGNVHAELLQECVRRPAPERCRVRVVDRLEALDAPFFVRSEVIPQKRELGHVERLALFEVALIRRTRAQLRYELPPGVPFAFGAELVRLPYVAVAVRSADRLADAQVRRGENRPDRQN